MAGKNARDAARTRTNARRARRERPLLLHGRRHDRSRRGGEVPDGDDRRAAAAASGTRAQGSPTGPSTPLTAAFNDVIAAHGLKLGKIAQPVRVAVTGGTASPGIFEVLEILGRDRTLARLDAALGRVA